MKKLFVLLLLLFTTESHSSGIASNSASAPCTNNTLETYSGNSNLAADWAPNEIQLRWYDNNTLLDVQSAANTCVYDGSLTIPQTAPTRTGYTFAGWTVRPQYDFSTLNPATQGTGRYAVGVQNNKNICALSIGNGYERHSCDNVDFKDLQRYEWKVTFNYGVIYGMSMCSETYGINPQTGNPSNVYGPYCWCKVTGYKPNNNDVIYAPTTTPLWTFGYEYSVSDCYAMCAMNCADFVQLESSFRTAIFR